MDSKREEPTYTCQGCYKSCETKDIDDEDETWKLRSVCCGRTVIVHC